MKRYLWTYKLGNIKDDELDVFRKTITDKLCITDLFVSMNDRIELNVKNFGAIAEIIEQLTPINVHPMLFQDPHYTFLTKRRKTTITGKLEIIKEYNEVFSEHKLKGIHIDIEPHAMSDFPKLKNQVAEQRGFFNNYRNVVSFINREITRLFPNRQNITFSAAVGWWYEAKQFASSMYLDQYLDEIVPMIYNTPENPIGNSLEEIKKRSISALNKYYSNNSSFVIGMGIYEFTDYMKLITTIEEVELYFVRNHPDNFKGIALFSDKDLERLRFL